MDHFRRFHEHDADFEVFWAYEVVRGYILPGKRSIFEEKGGSAMRSSAIGICVLCVFFLGVTFDVVGNRDFTTRVSGTYADSQVDTLKLPGDQFWAGLNLGIATTDSVDITKVVLRRVIAGNMTPVLAGDTLTALAGADTATGCAGAWRLATVAVAPKAEEYWFFVTYTSSGNGVTSPNVSYIFLKSY